MADSNLTYSGVGNEREPNVDLGGLCDGGVTIAGGCLFGIGEWKEIAEPINTAIRAVNEKSAATREAVLVAYTTGTDRDQWLRDRIMAIDARVAFIRERVNTYVAYITSLGSDVGVTLEKAFTAALSLVPVVGQAITLFEAGAQANRSLEAFRAQSLIQQYTDDIKQLAEIRKKLNTELVGTNTTTVTGTDTTSNAATAIPTWYYFAGAGAVLIFLMWLKSRKPKRRKR